MKIETKYKIGQKVYEKVNENIMVWTITEVNVEYTTYKEKELEDEYVENYTTERKEKVWLLETKIVDGSFWGSREDVFATKQEALDYIKKIKEAKEIVDKEKRYIGVEDDDNNSSEGYWNDFLSMWGSSSSWNVTTKTGGGLY